jgi:hypothetical protein
VWKVVDEVRLVEWPWEVTGKTYPSDAADGEVIEDVTHLVRDDGIGGGFSGVTGSLSRSLPRCTRVLNNRSLPEIVPRC